MHSFRKLHNDWLLRDSGDFKLVNFAVFVGACAFEIPCGRPPVFFHRLEQTKEGVLDSDGAGGFDCVSKDREFVEELVKCSRGDAGEVGGVGFGVSGCGEDEELEELVSGDGDFGVFSFDLVGERFELRYEGFDSFLSVIEGGFKGDAFFLSIFVFLDAEHFVIERHK